MSPDFRPRGPLLLPLYLAVVMLTGALLAPLLAELGLWYVGMAKSLRLEATPALGWLAEKAAGADFPRYFNRAFLIAALAWLVPFARWAGVTRADMGLERNPWKWREAVLGFLLAAGLLLAMGYLFVQWGRFAPNPKNTLGGLIGPSLFAAVCVALLEEFFFRGALFGFLLRSMRPTQAMVFLAAFFALLHLLTPPETVAVEHTHWWSGLWMVGQIFAKFGSASFLLAEFCTLFVVGWILGLARWHTRSLWLAIGLHAGWVLGVKLFGGLTRTAKKINLADFSPWIGKDLKSGIAPLATLIVTGLLVWLYLGYRKRQLSPS